MPNRHNKYISIQHILTSIRLHILMRESNTYRKTVRTSLPKDESLDVRNMSKTL
jgi:hypothetical protein